MPYHIFFQHFLLYKLDTLLLKQKNLPVLDITGFFFRIRTRVTALVLRTSAFTWVLMRKKKPIISNTGRFFSFNSTVFYTCSELRQMEMSHHKIGYLYSSLAYIVFVWLYLLIYETLILKSILNCSDKKL